LHQRDQLLILVVKLHGGEMQIRAEDIEGDNVRAKQLRAALRSARRR
jgi:hypothetical protein